jgi:hypothetical protein
MSIVRRRVIAALVVSAVSALVIVLAITRPWLALIDVRVDEAIPTALATAEPSPDASVSATAAPPAGPISVATGTFISHEHETTGTATVIENPDGSRVLALENLSTTNGPDVHVWLSASDVVPGTDGWFVAGGAPFIDLGAIKGNQGNQVYEIPEGVDLAEYRSVSLWCVQFSVSFGAAQLV